MSKESGSREAGTCACGQTVAFPEYHWPHCPMNPVNLGKHAKAEPQGIGARLLTSLQAKFTKAELASIASHGPVKDEKLRSNRRGRA